MKERNYMSKYKINNSSTTLQLTGNCCKKLEEDIMRFCIIFIKESRKLANPKSTTRLYLFRSLIQLWQPISAELCDTTTTFARVNTYQGNVEVFTVAFVGNFPS